MPQEMIVSQLMEGKFGASLQFRVHGSAATVGQCERRALRVRKALNDAGGLLVIPGLDDMSETPALLARLSRVFGPEVENYYETLTSKNFFHDEIPEVLVLSNRPPCSHPPPPSPDPELTDEGKLPVQFPHRTGWHTDQSYRRPPPDISLLYAVATPPQGQGQTLYADCTAAWEALDPAEKRRIEGLQGIHSPSWIGRSEQAVRDGETPKPLLAHQLPQRQPLVRVHPSTGRRALYLCESKQMDYIDGPIEGLEPGPDGEGARLLNELLAHATRPEFVYAHEWTPGDLVISDNRCLLHTATWYDADRYERLMWRTTVMGNAGREYEGEAKSWISTEGYSPMHGMENI